MHAMFTINKIFFFQNKKHEEFVIRCISTVMCTVPVGLCWFAFKREKWKKYIYGQYSINSKTNEWAFLIKWTESERKREKKSLPTVTSSLRVNIPLAAYRPHDMYTFHRDDEKRKHAMTFDVKITSITY